MSKKSATNQLQCWFAQINASWALEGHVMDAHDLENQRRIVAGEATPQQILAELRRRNPRIHNAKTTRQGRARRV